MSCPIGYTCPYIDATIDSLKESIELIQNAIDSLEGVVKDCIVVDLDNAISIISDQFDRKSSNLEVIRSANASIREWGEKMEEELELLEGST